MNRKHLLKSSFLLPVALLLNACTGSMDGMDDMSNTPPTTAQNPLAITYRAAYVVVGANNRLAVLDLDQMIVRDTLSLTTPPGSGTGGMSMAGMPGMSMAGMNWPHHLSLSPDGKKIAVAFPGMDLSGGHDVSSSGMGGAVALFDATTGTLLASVALGNMNHNAAFSRDGKTVWTSQMMSSGKILILDGTTLARLDSIPVGGMPAEVSFDSAGSMAFVANGASGTVSVINTATRKVVRTIAVGSEPVGAWQGMGGHMYVDNEMGMSIYHLHADSTNVLDSILLGFTPGMAQMHQATGKLWVTDSDNGRIVCFRHDSTGWSRTDSLSTGAGAHAVAFTKDGSQALVTNQLAGTISVINTASMAKVKDIPVGTKPNGIVLREAP